MLSKFIVSLLLLVGTNRFAFAQYENDKNQEFIRTRVQMLKQYKELKIDNARIAFPSVLAAFYENRNHLPAWSKENADQLLKAINKIKLDGLDPIDYHWAVLNSIGDKIESGPIKDDPGYAARDMVLTDAFLRLAYHIKFGKVDADALDANWNMTTPIGKLTPAVTMEGILQKNSVLDSLNALKPKNMIYVESKKTLQQYRNIAAAGGWTKIPDGQVLKPNMEDDRLKLLAKRLFITGDLGELPVQTSSYNKDLVDAVKAFQKRHGLDEDGVIGKGTLSAMNVPVEHRIDQIRVNLERGRWVLRDLPDRYILVNIAGFKLNYVEDGKFKWRSKVQVGKTFRKTPVFKSDMKYIVFNCTWTVPPTILKNDVIPAIKRNPNYLSSKNMDVLDSSGNKLNASTIDWSKYSAANFPFIIRQGPGPANALGLVKFIYPNKHFVFLHDTPSKSLFQRADRSFSSGCIRVQDPFVLAEILLKDKPGWDMNKINQVLATKKETTIYLKKNIPVLALYWTAFHEFDGTAQFRKDIYDRDEKILEGLNKPFKVKQSIQKKLM